MQKPNPRIQIGSIENELQEAISRETGDFAIPLVLDNQLIGTGTLIRVGESRGILTAAHVVRNPFGKLIALQKATNSS
jgi:hypothetical protein